MTITEDPRGFYRIALKYHPKLIDQIKKIDGRRFNGATKEWIVPKSSEDPLKKFAGYARYFGPVEWMDSSTPKTVEDLVYSLPELKPLDRPHNLKVQPYPYQLEGIQRGLELKRFVNADAPGLGKSMQSIATINLANAFPCLVICPASLKINWEREWNKFTDKKAMVLTDSVKNNWPFYWQTGLYQVFIVNYESLKKYFVQRIKKSEKWTLRDVEFRNTINLFKSVIIDESHRCFTYDTKVLTNKGLIKIGDIVENKMTDLLVASWNFSTGAISYNKISNVWRNEIKGRNVHRLHSNGKYIECTEDHKIYVDEAGWKKAVSIRSGDYLFALREEILYPEIRKNYRSMLLEKLRLFYQKSRSGNKSQDGQAQVKTEIDKGVCRMWKKVYSSGKWYCGFIAKILRKELFCKMEDETTGGFRGSTLGVKTGKKQGFSHKTNGGSRFEKDALRENEKEQSHEKSRNSRKNEESETGADFFIKGRKWPNHKRATNVIRCVESIIGKFGICNKHKKDKGSICIGSESLQSGHSINRPEDSNRGRWEQSQNKEMEISRPSENKYLKRVRLESNQVLEPRDYGRSGECGIEDQFVYDLEIENDHNYFANGFLVSNCKSSSTQQAKFTKGICAGKEWIIELTGTPVVNKPKDLVPQLSILGRMEDFDGYKNFVQRYCSGPNEASNLKELNYKLWTNCMFRREKHDVLKDLPDKVRQTMICEITNRKEYQDAERDLIQYLIKYKDATDDKIQRALRGEVMVRINILRQISARGKIKEVVEFVQDFRENNQKIILFCSLHEVVDGLKKAFPNAVSVTGRENQQQKQEAIDSFQKNPKTDIIICSIKAAGVGLTLTASSNVAFIEFPWTYADCVQCEDRAHRIGQKDSVTCYYFLGKKTIDEKVYQIIQMKKAIANTVMGSTEEIPENIVDLIAKLFNEKDQDDVDN